TILKSRIAAACRARLCSRRGAAEGGVRQPRFRTIQVCPKDLPAHLRQVERGGGRLTAAPGGWDTPGAQDEAARLYRGSWRRSRSVAAYGARAAIAFGGSPRRRAHDNVFECGGSAFPP